MPDPILVTSMVLLAALLEWSPRRLVPIGAVLAVGVVLSDDGENLIGVFALAGAVGIALGSILTALEARRGRNRAGASLFAQAQREALRARLSGSGTYARITFTMAALPGPTGKLLYPLIGAMRAPLTPAVVGTVLGRTVILAFTTWLFTSIARALSNDDPGAAQFLVSVIVVLVVVRTINLVDWEHRSREGKWRMRNDAGPMGGRMFMGGTAGMPGMDPEAFTRAHARDDDHEHGSVIEGDVVEVDIIDEEILDDEHDEDADQASGSSASGELPRGS